MISWPVVVLAQCPCSGGSGGDSSGVGAWLILIVAFGTWLLVRFIRNKKGESLMGKVGKITVVVVLAVAVLAVIVMKKCDASSPSAQPTAQAAGGLPRLVDLGSTSCIPCKMMAPILDDLKKTYAGQMRVEFIDVNQNPDAAKPFGIKLIPTQVFFDARGKELWRHEGFISKEDILAKWKDLGVALTGPSADSRPASSPAPAVKSGST